MQRLSLALGVGNTVVLQRQQGSSLFLGFNQDQFVSSNAGLQPGFTRIHRL